MILNKSDLPRWPNTDSTPNAIETSGLTGKGIDSLKEKIIELAGIKNSNTAVPVCFTARQEKLLTQLTAAKTKEAADPIITELLSGPLNV
jgi:tRNA U34 5-carboxymethylaminomethyl modifying GTPase MnmE/TrmE